LALKTITHPIPRGNLDVYLIKVKD